MVLLQANNIKKSYGVNTVLDFERFVVYEGDKIGIVGRNGAGKTTLLNILAKETQPDEGTVVREVEAAFIRQITDSDSHLSGGENQKLQIRTETQAVDSILFADEPTANLDGSGIAWVKNKLHAAKTVLLISHDRELLDDICTRIVEVRDGGLCFYTGNYTDYQHAVEVKEHQQQEQYEAYRQKKQQLEIAARKKERKVQSMHSRHKLGLKKNSSEHRLRGDKLEASYKRVEREGKVLKERLGRLEKVEKVRQEPKLLIDFSLTQPPGNKFVVTCENLHFSYGEKEIFTGASFQIPGRKKVALTGGNGAGKTTLLNLIREQHDGIKVAPKLRCGVLYQNFQSLDLQRTVLENVLMTSVQDNAAARSVLAGLLFRGDDVHKKVEVLSGGEKMRLQIAKLITSENNALLLDEPTNFLDIPSIAAVREVLREYPGTLLIVSHDRRFLQEVTDTELRVENGRVIPVQPEKASQPSPVEKTQLEIRQMKLLGDMTGADPDTRQKLEREYAETTRMLREWRP